MDAFLPIFHFIREPNWDPVEHPQDINHPCYEKQQDELEFVIFLFRIESQQSKKKLLEFREMTLISKRQAREIRIYPL